jgi:hypothetical protein
VRCVNMATTLVWPQNWGKAEVATAVSICSVFEVAKVNGGRGWKKTRPDDENEETSAPSPRYKHLPACPGGHDPVEGWPGKVCLGEAMIRTDRVSTYLSQRRNSPFAGGPVGALGPVRGMQRYLE